MFSSTFTHTSGSARVALVGIILSGLKHLHCLPEEEMRTVWVMQPLLWVWRLQEGYRSSRGT